MSEQLESYTIAGKTIPHRPENEVVQLAQVSVYDGRLEVCLPSHPFGYFRCDSEIWQHTIYEIEMLSETMRTAAAGPFPPPLGARPDEPDIGDFFPTICIEVCYSLESPGAQRASFFCRSKRTLPKWGGLNVFLGVALDGAFAEVVLQPEEALTFADWLDRQIQTIKINADQESTVEEL